MAEPTAHRAKVLIVEDEAIVALDLKERVERLGYEALGPAISADQAVDLAKTQLPDLVLMDIRLRGDGDGVNAAEEIQKQSGTPIIFITAYGDDPTFRRVLSVNPAAFLLKPIDDRELSVAMAAAVRDAEVVRLARKAITDRESVLASVTHDLNTPLTVIAMATHLLRRSLSAAGDGARRQVDAIERSTSLMRSLVHDLIDTVLIDTGRLTLDVKVCPAERLIADIVAMFEPVAEKKHVHLESHPPGSPCPLACDRDRILDLLTNLVSNAVKATGAGGVVTVEAQLEDPEHVHFVVRDTGAGMTPDCLSHLFERSWRGTGSHERGLGLGLFISKGIAEAHGGRIWAESSPGAGSKFHVALPIDPHTAQPLVGPRAQ